MEEVHAAGGEQAQTVYTIPQPNVEQVISSFSLNPTAKESGSGHAALTYKAMNQIASITETLESKYGAAPGVGDGVMVGLDQFVAGVGDREKWNCEVGEAPIMRQLGDKGKQRWNEIWQDRYRWRHDRLEKFNEACDGER